MPNAIYNPHGNVGAGCCNVKSANLASCRINRKERRRKEKTLPFGINLMTSQVLHRAAQCRISSSFVAAER
jgi:hypothetical protein